LSNVVIYHNPRCSKSRQTLELIRGNGVEPEIIEYLNDTPSADELADLFEMLSIDMKSFVRTKEDIFKELKPDLEDVDTLFKVMNENPKLIERPIVVSGTKAVIGRPPENVLEIL
jgi:arsenate reductase